MNFTKFIPSAVLIPVIAALLSACGGSNGISTDDFPIFSESEFTADSKAITKAAENLESVGLKFKTTQTDQQNILVSWDKDAVKPDTETNKNTAPYLKNYIAAGETYLKKYAQKFTLRRETGVTQGSQLKEQVRIELKARITVAQKTIEAISTNPQP